jgi:hypothetical protein
MSLSMLPTGLRGLPPRVEAEVMWPARGQGDAAATERKQQRPHWPVGRLPARGMSTPAMGGVSSLLCQAHLPIWVFPKTDRLS